MGGGLEKERLEVPLGGLPPLGVPPCSHPQYHPLTPLVTLLPISAPLMPLYSPLALTGPWSHTRDLPPATRWRLTRQAATWPWAARMPASTD